MGDLWSSLWNAVWHWASTLAFAQTGTPDTEAGQMTLWQIIQAGGSTMYFLGALSVAGLALVLYHLFVLRARRVVPEEFVRRVQRLIMDNAAQEAEILCNRQGSFLGTAIGAALSRRSLGPAAMIGAMDAAGRRYANRMRRRLLYLSEVATLSPMLGLFGTVVGMLEAFNYIGTGLEVKHMALAAAVAKALVTTVAGLAIAMPCQACYYLFRGKLNDLLASAEEVCRLIGETIQHRGGVQ